MKGGAHNPPVERPQEVQQQTTVAYNKISIYKVIKTFHKDCVKSLHTEFHKNLHKSEDISEEYIKKKIRVALLKFEDERILDKLIKFFYWFRNKNKESYFAIGYDREEGRYYFALFYIDEPVEYNGKKFRYPISLADLIIASFENVYKDAITEDITAEEFFQTLEDGLFRYGGLIDLENGYAIGGELLIKLYNSVWVYLQATKMIKLKMQWSEK